MTRYFKLCGANKFLALTNQDAIDMLLADFAWYEIPAWDYERRNRRFAHRVHITPALETQDIENDNALNEADYRNEGTGYFDIA